MLDLRTMEHPERSLYFTSPSSLDGELNTEDPLGLDYVAQQVGLLLLPALTTRSTRAQGFAMVLYGLQLASAAVDHYGYPGSDERKRELFERWERFWALATLEYRGGPLPRSDWDVMRGVRGATKAWTAGGSTLPLDFALISRQQELGSLGAYLVPLRKSGLVHDGDIRPTPAALEILDAFWDDPKQRDHTGRYERYALAALSLETPRIARTHDGLTLGAIGRRSRLSSLVELGRREQQKRLNEVLFEAARDATTRDVAAFVEAAAKAGVREPRQVLSETIRGTFGAPDPTLRELLETALRFGDFMRAAVAAFDRAYAAVRDAGWFAAPETASAQAFGGAALKRMRAVCSRFLDAPCLAQIRKLPLHGAACVALAERFGAATEREAFDQLLRYHEAVHSERRRGGGWLREESGKLVLAVTSYRARPAAPRYPTFKLDAVRMLLADVGRLSYERAAGDGE